MALNAVGLSFLHHQTELSLFVCEARIPQAKDIFTEAKERATMSVKIELQAPHNQLTGFGRLVGRVRIDVKKQFRMTSLDLALVGKAAASARQRISRPLSDVDVYETRWQSCSVVSRRQPRLRKSTQKLLFFCPKLNQVMSLFERPRGQPYAELGPGTHYFDFEVNFILSSSLLI